MSALTARERARLDALANRLAIYNTRPPAGVRLADGMRTDLPDIDDVTIGRVLLAYAQRARRSMPPSTRLTVHGSAVTSILVVQLWGAALDLTALDRRTPPC